MTAHDTDDSVLAHINRLVNEERRLWNTPDLDGHGQARLEAIRVELDQYWDLLRHREALREFGNDPNRAHIRPASIVEKYEG
jgi:hypothetical protein